MIASGREPVPARLVVSAVNPPELETPKICTFGVPKPTTYIFLPLLLPPHAVKAAVSNPSAAIENVRAVRRIPH